MSENEMPNQSNGSYSEQSGEFLSKAADACAAGDLVLGMHLYLAAYEKAAADPNIPDGMELSGLREAWTLACALKERSMAEYVFEKLEPYLTGEEIAACANKLQSMALDRLEEYGFSREELEGMAEMITQDFVSGEASLVKVESISIPHAGAIGVANIELRHAGGASAEQPDAESAPAQPPTADEAAPAQPPAADEAQEAAPESAGHKKAPHTNARPEIALADVDDFNPYDMYRDYSIGKSYHAATNEGSGAAVVTLDEERAQAHAEYLKSVEQQATPGSDEPPEPDAPASAAPAQTELTMANVQAEAIQQALQARPAQADAGGSAPQKPLGQNARQPQVPSQEEAAPQAMVQRAEATLQKAASQGLAGTPKADGAGMQQLSYKTLVGYDEAIALMRDLGVGRRNDREFHEFLAMLNEKHGLSRPPALDTLVFRAPATEDAMRFVDATAAEIGLPVLRMAMEEGVQGVPVLVVMTQGNHRPRMNHAQNKFEAPAILVIEELDTWSMPEPPEGVEGIGNFIMANISRGAREAVNLIRSAVEDPDVFVFATTSTTGEADPFFYDLLEPLTIIDISNPTDKERADIWMEIANDHPSMRSIDRQALVRLSAGLPRYDMFIAAREAIEEAYKSGLMKHAYVPVTPQNIFEKLAACQPLDSPEYHALEDEVIRNFLQDLEHLEDLGA